MSLSRPFQASPTHMKPHHLCSNSLLVEIAMDSSFQTLSIYTSLSQIGAWCTSWGVLHHGYYLGEGFGAAEEIIGPFTVNWKSISDLRFTTLRDTCHVPTRLIFVFSEKRASIEFLLDIYLWETSGFECLQPASFLGCRSSLG